MNKFLYLFPFSLFFCFHVTAQNNNSPYSIIGIGDIEKSNFDRTTGMGSAGIAMSSNRFMYQSNPASYVSLDNQFFYFDITARYKSVNYSGVPIVDPTQATSSDLQFKKIAAAVKLKKRWAISIGLLPYSTVNYSFLGTKSVLGSNYSTPAYYTGVGSTNKLYIANSFSITKNLTVGIEFNDIFGQIKETEAISPGVIDTSLTTNRNILIGKSFFKAGFQYGFNLSKKVKFRMGGTISQKATIKADYALLVTDGNTVIVNNETYKTQYFTLPVTYAGGVAAIFNNAYTIAADYTTQNWAANNTTGLNYSLVDSRKLALGFEYSNKVTYYNQTIEKYFLQTGIFYTDSYLKINGVQLKDYGLSFGFGGQLRRSGLGLQCALELGLNGTTNNNLIKERYTQLNFTLSYRDLWFVKRKYD
jgi:hypothetical protein